MTLLLSCSLAWAQAVTVDEVPNPRAANAWVVDLAGALDADQTDRLNARADALHRETTAELVVVTVSNVDAPTPKDFATELFNTWGVGDAQANNGVLVLLVVDQRRLEIETGYGLEAQLPDGWLGGMQAREMVPWFKQSNYGAGLEAGVAAIDDRLRLDPSAVALGTGGEVYGPERSMSVGGTDVPMQTLLGGGALGFLGMLGAAGGLYYRRRQRTCPTCNIPMPKLSEMDEDEHLDEGQQFEEEIGSIQYNVHQCPKCQHVRTFSMNRLLSGFSRCPQCDLRSRTTHTVTLRAATQYSTGLKEINEQCANCSYSHTSTRVTPRLPKPSTSSGSSSGGFGGGSSGGGGSFGGGRSGGGGAGSSW
jgi:uncharacterized protein